MNSNQIILIVISVIIVALAWNYLSCDYEQDDLTKNNSNQKENFYNISYPYWYYDYYPWQTYPRWHQYYNTPKWWRFNKWYYNRPSWWLPKY